MTPSPSHPHICPSGQSSEAIFAAAVVYPVRKSRSDEPCVQDLEDMHVEQLTSGGRTCMARQGDGRVDEKSCESGELEIHFEGRI